MKMALDSEDIKKDPWYCTTRYGLAFIFFLGYINLYAQRINMSVAIVCMVNNTALQIEREAGLEWSNITYNNYVEKLLSEEDGEKKNLVKEGEFNWSREIQGNILSSFFWGYVFTQIPGGWLSVKLGGKQVIGWSMFGSAICTLLVPVGARISYILLMILRFINGLCQGVVWPATSTVWAYWAPPLERSKLVGFTYAGAQLGNVIALPISAVLCDKGFAGGWPSIFYVFGMLGAIWFIAWMIIASDTPEKHPRISRAEREYILKSCEGQMKHESSVPWRDIFTSKGVWALILAHTSGTWGTHIFVTSIPTYMNEILKFDITVNGLLSSIPYIGMWITINVSAQIADTLRAKKILSTTATRKLFSTLGLIGPGLFCIALSYVDSNTSGLGVFLLTMGVSLIGCAYGGGFMVNNIDIAPKYSAILFGIANTGGTISGILGPYSVGQLTTNQSVEEWRVVFFITAGMYAFGTVVYLAFGTGELQDWAIDQEDKKPLTDHMYGPLNTKYGQNKSES